MKGIKIKACCLAIVVSLLNIMEVQAQQKDDSVVNVAFGTVARKDLLGAVSTVNVSELLKKSYGTYSLDNLASLVSGYTGNANIWGQGALILVDGVPRRASDIRLVEVESITVLKGASAVVLYGSNAAKGVVLINTKRGSLKPLSIDVRANTGFFVPKSLPKYIDAAAYKALYNEALTNDGIPITAGGYRQGEMDSTRLGLNPYKYSDIDFFGSDYLRKMYSRSDITTEISGGNNTTRYYSNIGMFYNNNLVKYGEHKKNNDFGLNLRANVDMNINSWLSANSDIAIVLSNNYSGRGDFWGSSSTIPPNFNRFSPLLPISMFDTSNHSLQEFVDNSNNVIDGQYLLGGQSTNQTNVLADMLASGYVKTRNRVFMYNVGVKADLGSVLQGLSFKAGYSMDYTTLYNEVYQVPGYAVYRPTWGIVNGRELITSLQKFGNDQSNTTESVSSAAYNQTMSMRSQFDYNQTFATDHNVTATLMGWWYKTQISSDPNTDGGSDYHPIRNTNLGFRAGYNYKEKYYLDFSSALVHSAKLPEGNRDAVSPAVTVGWRISNEDFFKNGVSFIDNIKISGSYASIKQDLDITGTRIDGAATDYYLYEGYYANSGPGAGWYQWRDNVAGGNTSMQMRAANPNLGFIERQEYRASLDASFLKSLITLDANYFVQNTNGLLTRGASIYPSYFSGNGDFRNWLNFNNDRRSGVDFALNLNKSAGQFSYSVGVTGMVYSSKATRRDEIYQDAYQNREGEDLDASWGYISEGFFQSQDEINNSNIRYTFGDATKPGDIKYKDVNNDGAIDTRDQVNLGRSGNGAAPFTYGVNLTLKWKNLTLFALGNGQTGAVSFKNSSYFWLRGTSKFSDVVWKRWTDATKNTATYPRLTSFQGNNNYQNSSFWMYKTDRFNLNRVQLTYDFNEKIIKNSFVHGLSVYVLGDNLLVLSKERKLMETNIGTAPQYRFYNIGVKASF